MAISMKSARVRDVTLMTPLCAVVRCLRPGFQIYTPGYLLNSRPRPVVTRAPSNISYGHNFTVAFSNVSAIDRVVLDRLTGATHGNHFDQRQVVLDCHSSAADRNASGSSVACAAPPNSSVAPPGQYMLFALAEGVPSYAPTVYMRSQAGGTADG